MLGLGVDPLTRRILDQQSEELPFRVSQQQYARQPQQQQRFSSMLCGPQRSSMAAMARPELAGGNLSGVPQKSPEVYSSDAYPGIQKSNRVSYFGRATEDLAGPPNRSPMALNLRRTPRTAQGFVEPLLAVGDALPLHMVLIPGGTFQMGQTETEKAELIRQVGEEEYTKYYERELPQHDVTLQNFFMGRYPITQAQWQAVAALPKVKQDLDPDPSNFKGHNRPVEQVSWFDAEEFCLRLTHHTGRPYRLPTEAEWEYACRAGTTTPFYFGPTLTTDIANYDGNYTYADGPKGEYRKETTPVDHFGIANAFGLCDMHGNVWEWCQDHWHSNYDDAPTDGSAWIEGGNSDYRVRRGGSWISDPRYCRSAFRFSTSPVNRNDYFGFRVCCAAPRAL